MPTDEAPKRRRRRAAPKSPARAAAVTPNEQKDRARRKASGESLMPDPGNKKLLAAAEQEAAIDGLVRRMEIQREAERRIAERAASARFQGFASVSLRAALAKPREVKPAIIESLQMQGHKATLTAQYKAGKTTLSSNAVRSLADGVPFLDRFEVMDLPGNIGVFDYELTQDDALDLYSSLGIKKTDRIFLEPLRGEGFSLANEFHRELTVEWITEHDIVYWVIDPFGRALRGFGSENDNDDVRVFFDAIDSIVAETGLLGTLMPVHTGRAQHEVGSEHGRGATAVDDDADARWILTRDAAGQRFFRAEGRNGVSVDPEVSLEFDRATSLLTVGELTRRQSSESARVERALPRVEAFFAANPGAGTRDYRDGIDGKNSDLDRAVALGIAKGTIRIEQQGSKKAHFFVPQKKVRIRQEGDDE